MYNDVMAQQKTAEIRRARREIICWLLALGLSVVAIVLGWFGVGNFFGENSHAWFSKSGAFSTAGLIWAGRYEGAILRRYFLGPMSLPISAAKQKILKVQPILEWVTFFFAIISAFIWGYGDTFHKWINS